MDGTDYAVAYDPTRSSGIMFARSASNLQEKRMMEQRPVQTDESEFANARLLPADQDDVVVAGAAEQEDPYEVLDVAPDAPDAVVKAAFRALANDVHPDKDGRSRAEFQRTHRAKEAMLDE